MTEVSPHFYDGDHERAMLLEGSSILPDSLDEAMCAQDDYNALMQAEIDAGRVSVDEGEVFMRNYRLVSLGFLRI